MVSETTLETEKERFAVINEYRTKKWKKFWKEAIFFLGGAAVLAL